MMLPQHCRAGAVPGISAQPRCGCKCVMTLHAVRTGRSLTLAAGAAAFAAGAGAGAFSGSGAAGAAGLSLYADSMSSVAPPLSALACEARPDFRPAVFVQITHPAAS